MWDYMVPPPRRRGPVQPWARMTVGTERPTNCRERHWICDERDLGSEDLQMSGCHRQDHHGETCGNRAGFGYTTTSGSWPRRFLVPLRIQSGNTKETAGCGVGHLKWTKHGVPWHRCSPRG